MEKRIAQKRDGACPNRKELSHSSEAGSPIEPSNNVAQVARWSQGERGINEIEEMERLLLIQLKRIALVAEVKDGKLLSVTNAEIKLAADILDKIIEWRVKLGLLDHEPQQISITGGRGVLGLYGDEEEKNAGIDEGLQMRMGLAARELLNALTRAFDDDDTK